ncbi:polysaccharide deacetylase family protein [Arthrobacter sp. PAMC25564]|uniref:polysaccharide deacetylase family protein n=1 Tax=Arthrobacter sp. PAMC25564 TaxID=2565366 RepID=UPI001F1013E3|nr:polysaccharide deacetylase family protein [Arthrobacter sp. PAMC25564]
MFSLDDNRAQNVELVALHEALGQKITLAITSSWVDQTDRLTSAQILDYHKRGHEIANHTTTHANYTGISAAARQTETDTCSQFIFNLTGRWPSTFVYPFGAWNAASNQELYTRFRSWAMTCSATTDLPLLYQLGDTFPWFYRLDLDNPLNLDRAKELIRMAAYSPIIVSFYTHWTDQSGTMTKAQYQSIAQVAYDLNVPCVLPRDVFGQESRVADPSFEVAGLPNWLPTKTGAATTGRVSVTPDVGLSGAYAAALTATNPDTAQVSQAVQVSPGTWRISGRVKQDTGAVLTTNDFGVQMKYRNADETVLSSQTLYPTLSAIGVWARFQIDVTVPAGARFGWLGFLNAPGATRGGTLHVDHVDIRPIEQGSLG